MTPGLLREALEDLAAALAAGDPEGAEAAAARAEGCCAAIHAAGAVLQGAELAELQALHARAVDLAGRTLERLGASVQRAGRSVRAERAYGRSVGR